MNLRGITRFQLAADLRVAARLIRRRPLMASALVLTLGLGVGANTTIFEITRRVLLQPLPYAEPERLVALGRISGEVRDSRPARAPLSDLVRWRDEARVFESIAAYDDTTAPIDMAGEDGALRVKGAYTSVNLFDVLGVPPFLGRTFRAVDGDVAVLSHAFWRRQFGADPGAVGRRIQLWTGNPDRHLRSFTVIGVLPPGVDVAYPDGTDLWIPLPPGVFDRGDIGRWVTAIARLKPGATTSEARADMERLTALHQRERANPTTIRYSAMPLHEYSVGDTRPTLLLLGAIASVVLIIACVNVIFLLLARTADRRQEIAVRMALGAGRRAVLQVVLSEALVFGVIGGAIGVGVAYVLAPVLRALIPSTVPRTDQIAIDPVSVAWAVLIATLISTVAGLAPTWRAGRIDIQTELQSRGALSRSSATSGWWRQCLAVAQIALMLVLLTISGLLLRSFWHLQRADLGFHASDVLTATVRFYGEQYRLNPQLVTEFQERLLARVRALPGVVEAGLTTGLPLSGMDQQTNVRLPDSGSRTLASRREVDPSFFAILGIQLVDGRYFDETDSTTGPRVAVMSRSLARAMFPDGQVVGRILEVGFLDYQPAEIVGIVDDVRYRSANDVNTLAYYIPRQQQQGDGSVSLVVKHQPDARGLGGGIRTIVKELEPDLPVLAVRPLADLVNDSMAARRFYALSAAGFAGLAVFLAAAGLYGLVAQSVSDRVRELGIRLAMGAEPRALVRLIMAQAFRLIVVGIGLGTLLAIWAARLIEQFLYGVGTADVATRLASIVLIVTIFLVASYIPARRISRLSPAITLSRE
jgi:predicted permease